MDTNFLTTTNILFAITIIGVLFSIYRSYHNPQEDLEKKQAVSESEVDGKAQLLAQQVQWQKEATERRFSEIQVSIKDSMSLAQNHIHSVDVKVENLTTVVGTLNTEITRLATIISERIPRNLNIQP